MIEMRKVTIIFTLSLIMLSSITIVSANGNYEATEVLDFDPPAAPEGIAFDKTGNLYVGIASNGSIVKMAPNGDTSILTTINIGFGFLLGLATDAPGNVYAGVATFNPETHGVWKISKSGQQEVLATLPLTSLPNGLAFDKRGDLYVSDSFMGAIWRINSQGDVEMWIADPLLLGDPSSPGFVVGANGIAFDKDGSLFIANTNYGRIVKVPVNPDGTAGSSEVVVEDMGLIGADGVAFDNHRNLYVTVNVLNQIVKITPQGDIETIADQPENLDSPASVAFGTGNGERKNLFITNAAFFSTGVEAGPSVWKINVDVPGRPLP
jgi:sugar lactone lactonase YvrE